MIYLLSNHGYFGYPSLGVSVVFTAAGDGWTVCEVFLRTWNIP